MTKTRVIAKSPQAIAILGLLTVALFITHPLYGQDQQQPAKPNVLFVFADDWGWGDLSLHDSLFVRTPNLDRFSS
jgi:N-acetylgalactosamine-6-sulfatase